VILPGPNRAEFIVIGAMKAATSTICSYLEDHPDTYMVPRAEPNYFSRDENFARGDAWYDAHFAPRTTETLCGEGSNGYSWRNLHPETAARMTAYNPDMKIIYMVRHPIDRIVSALLQRRTNSGDAVPATLDRAVREMPGEFVEQSRYWFNLAPYRDHFGDDRIHIAFMEDLNRDPQAVFDGVCDFLGVARFARDEGNHQNRSIGKRMPSRAYTAVNRIPGIGLAKRLVPGGLKQLVRTRLLSRKVTEKPRLSADLRAELAAHLRPEAEALLDHCGKPRDFWRLD